MTKTLKMLAALCGRPFGNSLRQGAREEGGAREGGCPRSRG